ncbi:hybrid sensor histidine kinase/response regulator [Bacillus massiliigorillae]|uniref:hybrid sensor histidine kinase/response regulator n=1 Tax=Bacillus massiliigorillae TaxID=1243664 RepID=UPI0003A45191|nr:ATP-binding protein [Bacillus massiliigorillae]
MKAKLAVLISILILLELIFLVANLSQKTPSNPPTAENGILDLSNWDFEKDGIVPLNGEWEFVGDKLLLPKDFNNAKSIYEKVPRGWKSDSSIGTYRLTVYLPNNERNIGLTIRNIWSSHVLYVNGEKVKQVGYPDEKKAKTINKNVPYEYFYSIKNSKLELVFQVANYSNTESGIVQPIDIGTEQGINKAAHYSFTTEWAATVFLLIFAVYHLTLFMMRQRNTMYFYSGVYFFVISLLIATRKERIISRIFPDISFEWLFTLQDLSTYGSYVVLFAFLIHVEPKLVRKSVAVICLAPIILYVISFIVLPARAISVIQAPVTIYSNILFFYFYIRLLIMAFNNQSSMNRNEVWSLSGVIFFLFVTSLSGALDAARLSGLEFYNHIGILGFIVMMNAFLATRLKNETEKAEQLAVSLQKSNRIKDEFLAITSHEMKTPLHGIMNIVNEITKKPRKNLTNDQYDKLLIVEQTTEKLNYLLNDLQDFTKMRFDDLKLEIGAIDIRVITSIVYELLASDLDHKQISFENNIPANLCMLGDENRFRQVLFNVLHNAMKFTANGKIVVSALKMQNDVYLYIEDTGCGMEKKVIPSIFEFLYSEDYDSVSFNSRGMGLGLYISHQLMNNMGGRIWVEKTEVGNGTIIALALPFAEAKSLMVREEIEFKTKSKIQLELSPNKKDKGEKVLIVDDNPVNIQVLNLLLEEEFIPIAAYSGFQAMKILDEMNDIKYVITDVMMPGMSGVELVKKIREQYTLMQLPVIVATVLDAPRDIAMAFQAGANDYITKPFNKETVLTRLHTVKQIRVSMQKALEHEMAFLQAQIKPHFLYNALNAIIAFCYIDSERASHLLTMLSCYLRYVFTTGKEGHVTTLEDELEVTKAYVEIEQARFGERLSFVCDCSEEIIEQDIEIPSLFIQPMVENAIQHGLFNKAGNGTVYLRIEEKEAGFLSITVKDNGVGMSKQRLQKVTSEPDASNGIGLSNVRRRIRNIEGAEFYIFSELDEGTTIKIVIPKKVKLC